MTPKARRLYAEFEALPGSEEHVNALVESLTAQVRAEPGCLQFDPFVRADQSRRWVVFESYVDEDAFLAHLDSEHGRAFNAEVTAHIVGGSSSLVWLSVPTFLTVDASG